MLTTPWSSAALVAAPAPPAARAAATATIASRRASIHLGEHKAPERRLRIRSAQALLEPVVRVRLVVERPDLLVAGRAVEADRLDERPVRLEPYRRRARGRGVSLELPQEPPTEPEAARLRVDPHALELGGRAGMVLQRAAADRVLAQARDEEQAARRRQLVLVGGDAAARVEAGLE